MAALLVSYANTLQMHITDRMQTTHKSKLHLYYVAIVDLLYNKLHNNSTESRTSVGWISICGGLVVVLSPIQSQIRS